MTAVVFLGFNLLNARRGVKPTLATLGARLVVVIRSCWIFARRGDEKEGGSLRHTPCSIHGNVVYYRSVSPAVPNCKGDRILHFLLCGTEPQFITFGLKDSLQRFLA